MIRRLLLVSLLVLSCSAPEDPTSEDWARISQLEQNWRALSGEQRLEARQRWIDELRLFVESHPDHAIAATRFDDEQTEFAIQLAANGRYLEAVRHFQSVLERKPSHQAARRGLENARRFAERDDAMFDSLRAGDSQETVSEKVGLPRSGWTRRVADTELWYYELTDGRTIALRFVNGSYRSREIVDRAAAEN